MLAEHVHILLVEDDAEVQRLLCSWLRDRGYSVETVRDGLEAIQRMQARCPQVLITDGEIRGADGLELCRWVRSHELPNYVYTIFLTGRGATADAVTALEMGADDFMKKPVEQGELLARVRAGRRVLALESRLKLLARTDTLTGVATRRTFFELLNHEWSRAERSSEPISCVMVDIDFFKRVNDTYGHRVGDQSLRAVATLVQEHCRAADIVGRYGGEEFCIALPNTTEDEAKQWADRLRVMISSQRGLVEQHDIRLSASFGVAQRLSDTATPDHLIELADQALMVAKRSGRDRVVGFRSISSNTGLRVQSDSVAELLQGMTALDVMATIVVGLRQQDTVESAVRYFLRLRLHSAPVVDDDGKLVGILSEHDVMSMMLLPAWWRTRIAEVMKPNVACYEENTPVSVIYEFLSRVALRSVVIVRDGRPTGMISRASLLRWFTNLLAVTPVTVAGNDMTPRQSLLSGAPHELAVRVTEMMAREAQSLLQGLQDNPSEWLPAVVAGVSRLEELATDLLAHVRDASTKVIRGSHGSHAEAVNNETGDLPGLAVALSLEHLSSVADC